MHYSMILDDYERLAKRFLAEKHCNTIMGVEGGGGLVKISKVKISHIKS